MSLREEKSAETDGMPVCRQAGLIGFKGVTAIVTPFFVFNSEALAARKLQPLDSLKVVGI